MTSPLDTCLTGIDAALTTLLAARRRHRADARINFAIDVRQLVQAFGAGEVKAARDAHGRTLGTVDRLTAELGETTKTAAHRLRMIDELRDKLDASGKREDALQQMLDQAKHTITELQGHLAVAGEPILLQVPVGRPSAPEPSGAPSATPATASGGPRTAPTARKAAKPQSGEGGSSQRRTGRSRATDGRTIGVVGETPKGAA